MKFIINLLAITFLGLNVQAQTAAVPRGYINLSQGVAFDEKAPDLPASPQFDGDYKKVTKVFLDPNTKTLRFTPTNLGNGNLVVLDGNGKKVKEYYISVVKGNLNKVASEIKGQLQEIEGITIKIINGKVVVDGEVLLPKDIARITSVVALYEGQATSLVRMSPIAQKKISELIERDINNPEITCRAVNGKFILEGYANNEDEKSKAFIIAQAYFPDLANEPGNEALKPVNAVPVINLISVKPQAAAPPKKIIQLVVHYVELNKAYEKGFNFQWTPNLDDGTKFEFSQSTRNPSGALSSITGTISNLLPKLNWAKEHGHARVLQSSSVIVQEGVQGVIKSQTDIPYQVQSANGVGSTSFVKSGIETKITPSIPNPQSDTISLNISFEIGTLVGQSTAGPLISNNSIQTSVAVRSGQSAAVGGLVGNQSGTEYNKKPPGVENPIISLHSSKLFRRNQSQFVVFVTPVIKSSASAGSEKIKAKFKLKD